MCDEVTARIEDQIAPCARAVEQLDEITGVGVISAQELIAELGTDMTRFVTAGHLVSWVKYAPIDSSSASEFKISSADLVQVNGRGLSFQVAIHSLMSFSRAGRGY